MNARPTVMETRALIAMAIGSWALLYLPSLLNSGFGYFIDEFYYAACATRPAFGYVDHPPLAPWILAVVRATLGDSLWAIRLLPALAGSLTVVLTMLLSRRLGAGVWGQVLAGGAVLLASVPQILFGMFSMNAFSIPIWLGLVWIVIEIEGQNRPRLWLAFGALAGVGLMNKHTVVLLAFALGVALVLTPARRYLKSPWLWAGAGLALLIASPNLLWQMANEWPSLEFYRNANQLKNLDTPPLMVAAFQVLTMNPGSLPIWIAGVIFFFRSRTLIGIDLRHLGWVFVVLFVLIMASGSSRPDRIVGIYPLMFAGGAALLSRISAERKWIRWAGGLFLVGNGLVLLPIGVPVLSPEATADHTARLGVVPQVEAGAGKTSELPQWLADRTGWEDFVADVEAAVASLDPEERATTAIFNPSYGQAGALELLGNDLPSVHSGHNTYYLWGPPEGPITTAIVVGDNEERLRELFEEVTLFRISRCTLCMRWRNEMPIWIGRGLKRDMDEVWRESKGYG